MAQRKKSEVEFIQDTFCPQVAVLCSYDAEVVCRKNALTFVELVQPFCRFNGEIKISDPSNNLYTISNLRVEIKDINSMPPQPMLAKKLLDESVANGFQSLQNVEKQISSINYNIVANINTPWFESWRDSFIKIGYPDDHEFLKHFLSCIFVVSTSHLDPLDQFQKLVVEQQQPVAPNRLPKWFFPGSNYKYFVLLHDVQEGEISKAHQIYENLKAIYGSSNCHLLQINSKSAQQIEEQKQSGTVIDPWLKYCKFNDLVNNSSYQSINKQNSQDPVSPGIQTDSESLIENPLNNRNMTSADLGQNSSLSAAKPHGMCLALSDHDRIKTLISEFMQRGLVPYVERTIKMLNEQINSKKSILKSFGIPRRIFGGSSSSISSVKNSSSVSANLSNGSISGNTSLNSSTSGSTVANNHATNEELQLRRLADLAFMFRLYDIAYNSYHTCKKEFTSNINNTSQQSTEALLAKTLYLAGALEMASLSNFMQNHPSGSDSNTSLNTSNINSSKAYNLQYIDEAIQLLLNTCKNSYFATRCALLSTEALRANNLFVKAAYQFISLSGDDSDMRSALFLEQAAQCYLAMSMIRKYAFFMSIAGYRFNKAGQKKHSIRVYKHALDIYLNRYWFKAQDHLNFVMSRLNYNLKNLNEALDHINNIKVKRKLPQKAVSYSSQNLPAHTKIVEFNNEINVLKDYILYCNTNRSIDSSNKSLPLVLVPIIDAQNIKINLSPIDKIKLKFGDVICLNDFHSDYLHEPISFVEKEIINSLNNNTSEVLPVDSKQLNELRDMWIKFEQALYSSAYRTQVPLMFKPQVTLLDNHTDNKQLPKVIVNESCTVMFEMRNNLKINLTLTDITLLWMFKANNEEGEYTNENSKIDLSELVECSILKETSLSPLETYRIKFSITPKCSNGVLSILGLKYNIGLTNYLSNSSSSISLSNSTENSVRNLEDNNMLLGKQMFEILGNRLNNNPQNMRTIAYDVDNRLNLKVINETAILQVEMSQLPRRILCNQMERVRVYFINPSKSIPVGNIRIASNGIMNSRLCFNDSKKNSIKMTGFNKFQTLSNSEFKFKESNSESGESDKSKSEPLKFNFTHHHNQQDEMYSSTVNSTFENSKLIYSLDDVVINPGEHYELDLWIHASENEGNHKFYFMFFYEDAIEMRKESPSRAKYSLSMNSLKYRVIRYEFSLTTEQSLTKNNMSIINSQIDSNLLLNFEISNHQQQSEFEFINLISVSNIWQVTPINSSSKQLDFSINSQPNIESLVLKATPVNKNNGSEVFFSQSMFNSVKKIAEKMQIDTNVDYPDENVLFYFIKADLKKQLVDCLKKSIYLNVNFIWRSITKREDDKWVLKYGLMPAKVISDQCYNKVNLSLTRMQSLQRPRSVNNFNDVNNSVNFNINTRNFVLIMAKCTSKVKSDFGNKSLCSVPVNIELKNLSNIQEYDLIIIAKNPRNLEMEKKYLWLGCNKKYLKLKPNFTKQLKFKLGFYSDGIYEIGRVASETLLKTNLFEACNLNSAGHAPISLDEYLNEAPISDTTSVGGQSLAPSIGTNAPNQPESASISVFLKNNSNNRYELFKRLNPFTVNISKDI